MWLVGARAPQPPPPGPSATTLTQATDRRAMGEQLGGDRSVDPASKAMLAQMRELARKPAM